MKKKSNQSITCVKLDPSLDKLESVILFKEKYEKAQKAIRQVGLPTQKN